MQLTISVTNKTKKNVNYLKILGGYVYLDKSQMAIISGQYKKGDRNLLDI